MHVVYHVSEHHSIIAREWYVVSDGLMLKGCVLRTVGSLFTYIQIVFGLTIYITTCILGTRATRKDKNWFDNILRFQL